MTPDPVESDNRTEGDFNVSQVWLDALSRGACDEDAFLRAVQMLTRRSPEAAWDSLALLDQYHRRGKIKPDVFKRVKSRLGSQLLGPALDFELSVPLRRQVAQPPAAGVVTPVTPPAGAAAMPPVAPRSAPAASAASPATEAAPQHQGPSPPAAPKPGPAAVPAARSAAPAAITPTPASIAPAPAIITPPPPAPMAAPAPAALTPVPGPVAPTPITVAPAPVTVAPAPAPAAMAPATGPIAPAPVAAAAPLASHSVPPASLAPPPAALEPAPAPPAPARASVPRPAPPASAPPAYARPQGTDSVAPSVFLVPPAPREAVNPTPPIAGARSTGRTVPIGIESLPLTHSVARPVDEVNQGRTREVTVGDVLRGRYVIKNVLGLGGTATVFEAIDRYRLDLADSGQRVAVKVLHAGAAEQTAVLTDLRREFQLLQSLSHPNIVRVHEYDRDGDTAFFTMEYLSGLSLDSVLSAHRDVVLGRTNALVIIRDVAAAVEHAHSKGVVHGDLNPGNIFITNDGEIRVLDFGAAHTPSETPALTGSAWESTAFATPRFASCQLLDGERADVRDDTYSLACVLYVLLAGKHPFGDLNAAQARAQRLRPARPAGLTGKQWQALRAGLSFERQHRSADIAGWLEPFDLPKPEVRLPMLLALLKASPRRSRRGGAGVLVVVLLALAAAGWWASAHMDLVSQTAGDAGGSLKGTVASAEAALTQLWQQGRNALWGAPDENVPVASSTAPAASSAAPESSPPTPAPRMGSPVARALQPPSATGPAPPPRPAIPARAPAAAQPAAAAVQPSRTRIELAADAVDIPLSAPAAHVIVRRSGNLRADAGFTWWTESGTARPGQDFMSVKPHEEHFEDGKAVANLLVPVVADPTRREAKSFYIVINDPSGNASLGKRTLTMVTIPSSQ